VVAVQVACGPVDDAEIGMGLQDDAFLRRAEVADFGHASIPRHIRPHGFAGALRTKAIGIGRGRPGEGDGGRAVVVIISNNLTRQPAGHIAVGVIAERLPINHDGGVRARGEAAGVGIGADGGVGDHIATCSTKRHDSILFP